MTDEGQRTSTVPTAGVTPSRGTSAYALKVAPPAVATPPTTEPLGPEEKGPWTRGLLVRLLLRNALIMTLLLIAVGFGVINPHFATLGNASTLGIELSAMALLTFGEAGVLLTAGIDLSVGSIAGFSGVMAAEVLTHGGNFAEALVCAIVIGGAVGLVNGGLTAYAGIPAFIVTLGTMSAVLKSFR
jgi:ribose/xylose/arabinose/galactoside ABC-type transport system permease subunit